MEEVLPQAKSLSSGKCRLRSIHVEARASTLTVRPVTPNCQKAEFFLHPQTVRANLLTG